MNIQAKFGACRLKDIGASTDIYFYVPLETLTEPDDQFGRKFTQWFREYPLKYVLDLGSIENPA
jgi:hypothetical protein